VLLVACASDPCEEEDAACDCIAERRLPDGTCCLGLTRPDRGVCVARAWTRPAIEDAWGEPGATDVAVAVDSEGRGVAGWVATGDGQIDSEVVIGEERDGVWSLQQPGAALEGFGTRPAIATGPEGEVLVAWKQQLPEPPGSTDPVGDSWLARRRPDGTWVHPGPGGPLSLPPGGYDPQPLVTAWGEAFVVWNQWSGDAPSRSAPGFGVAMARRSADAEPDAALGRPAKPDDVLSPPVANSNEPRIAVGQNGDALVAWYQAPMQGGPLMIYVSSRARIDGEFSRPNADGFISQPGTDARNPFPAVDPFGNAAVVWAQDDGRGATPIYLATRLGDWTLPDDLDNPFSVARGVASGARVAFGRSELFVVWAAGEPTGRKTVFAAHRNAEGEWDAPGLAPTQLSSPERDAIDPSIAVGPHGEVIVVWSQVIDGSRREIATRRRNAGATAWSELDVLSPDDGQDAEHPVVAIGSTGRAVVAWQQGPAGSARIRFATME
jgi:hypothetical protein